MVGELHLICTRTADIFETSDGEVAGLEKDSGHIGSRGLESTKLRLINFQVVDVDRRLLRIGHEPTWRARLEPIGAQGHIAQRASQGNRVEHAHHLLIEAVSVVQVRQLREGAIDIGSHLFRKGSEPFREARTHLIVGIAQQSRGIRAHRYVGEVVQIREDGHLRELRNARHKAEALLGLGELDHGIKRLEECLEGQNLGLAYPTRERLVVLVDEQDEPAIFPGSRNILDKCGEAVAKVPCFLQRHTEPLRLTAKG